MQNGMEWHVRMENEMECRMYTNLCDWCYAIKVELATMYAIILPCLVTIMSHAVRKWASLTWALETSYSSTHGQQERIRGGGGVHRGAMPPFGPSEPALNAEVSPRA